MNIKMMKEPFSLQKLKRMYELNFKQDNRRIEVEDIC